MSEDEMEKFEITDYDLDNEFNMFRKRKGNSKHQQIYGIWADDSEDEDDGKSKTYKNNKKGPKNYTAPIGFVAGGVQQAGKKKELKSENVKSDESDEEKPTTSFKRNSSDSEDETVTRRGFGSSSSKAPVQSTVTDVTGDIAGMRSARRYPQNANLINKGVGGWEKHTKGIGAKLLLQMGFQPGKGLGKDLQGISAPVEAHLRKGRGAIGAYGPEKPASIPKLKEEIKREVDNGDKKWKKEDGVNKNKTRYYYRSVDDVIEQDKKHGVFRNLGNSSELSKVKVIDMTGPQQRVLSGYHALSGLKAPPGVEHYEDVLHKKCSNFSLPELQHNLDVLVEMHEQEIIKNDRDARYSHDRIVALEQEEAQLKNVILQEDKDVKKLKSILDVVTELVDPSSGLSLGQVAKNFKALQSEHYDEYCQYELGELAPGLVGPLLTSAMASWSPLNQPNLYIDVFGQWKDLLSTQRGTIEGNSMGILPYDSLLWHTWVPVMRTCVSAWSPRDSDSLITVMETWLPLLPPWILNNLYDQLIIPRLVQEVSSWDPLTDTIPVHTWVHPWIPLLDKRLEVHIYPIIQEKLGTALASWHPSDGSAKFILRPWQRVLPEGSFVTFLVKHIVPKLQLCMQSLAINPHQQHLDAWKWVMDWNDMLSVGNMTLILDKYFFPRWLQTLAMWLNHNPDYTQVTEWYTGWKRMISDNLLAQPTIKENFHKALELMNRAASSGQQPGAKESVSYLTNIETNVPPPPPPRIDTFQEAVRSASCIPQGYKDLIAKRCEERGILFVPIPNKYHEAKQVYRLGSNGTQCYIDRNVVFYTRDNSNWLPTSLTRLLDMA
ncbi:PREDICTED: septin-interacting protein 1 isoform X2 [Nicrophorus vespilloides]|uniref:Septin-interacting protein 1 isoform X2 n=1 Tax=Nicrophorus vespilloides TaxID=110193 RepID=A0ABM1NAH4_NICVS|nr:PREDICTED: septin-interacting protein 1 isoform X2 [Nicrophorus vespilloides]